MRQPRVVIYRPVDESGATHDRMRAAGCEVIVESLDLPGAVPSAIACDADVLLGATFRGGIMDAEFLAHFSRLRLI